MENLTIKEIKEEKRKTEIEIKKTLNNFIEKTGLRVSNIFLDETDQCKVYNLLIETKL